MKELVICFIQSLMLIIMTPLFMGVIAKVKAFLRGYKGASIVQPYYALIKLFRRGRVLSASSSFITVIGPSISFAASVTAAFLIPVFYSSSSSSYGNVFIIVFVISIIKFFNSLMGLDSASGFGGMGSSRELFISMLAEPIMLITIIYLYFETKSFNVFEISVHNGKMASYSAEHIIAAVAFFILIIAENARMPVDNPETHLELTMIHEAMILDLSGSDLALVELASSIKLVVLLTIFINCFIPLGIATSVSALGVVLIKSVLWYIIKMLIILCLIASIETMLAKTRLFRVPELLTSAASIGILAITIDYFI